MQGTVPVAEPLPFPIIYYYWWMEQEERARKERGGGISAYYTAPAPVQYRHQVPHSDPEAGEGEAN
jgi:hypothetical protein